MLPIIPQSLIAPSSTSLACGPKNPLASTATTKQLATAVLAPLTLGGGVSRVALGGGLRYRNDPYGADVMMPAANSSKLPSSFVASSADSIMDHRDLALAGGHFGSTAAAVNNSAESVALQRYASYDDAQFFHGPSEAAPVSASLSTGGHHHHHHGTTTSGASALHFPYRGAALAPIRAAVEEPIAFIISVKFRVFKEQHALNQSAFDVEWRGRSPVAGELVVVQGDRGEDIGSIELVEFPPSDPQSAESAALVKLPRVLRKANATEVTRFYDARAREDQALAVAQDCAARVPMNVQLSIVAVEYQADFQKLSLIFRVPPPPRTHPLRRAARQRVDFRELQRELFRRFKCRIWLVNETELNDSMCHPVA